MRNITLVGVRIAASRRGAERPHSDTRPSGYPSSVWRTADVETADNGAIFARCSCDIQRAWKLVDALPGGQWATAAEQARVMGGAMVKSRKSRVEFGRGLSSAQFALQLEQNANWMADW